MGAPGWTQSSYTEPISPVILLHPKVWQRKPPGCLQVSFSFIALYVLFGLRPKADKEADLEKYLAPTPLTRATREGHRRPLWPRGPLSAIAGSRRGLCDVHTGPGGRAHAGRGSIRSLLLSSPFPGPPTPAAGQRRPNPPGNFGSTHSAPSLSARLAASRWRSESPRPCRGPSRGGGQQRTRHQPSGAASAPRTQTQGRRRRQGRANQETAAD